MPGRQQTASCVGSRLEITCSITPESWDPVGGYFVPVERLADALLDPAYKRDGATILGGEPLAQSGSLLALVHALRRRGCAQILVYTGYTWEHLRRLAMHQREVGTILDQVDVLIDGPFVAALAAGAGLWTGSGNQRVIDLAATRRLGHPALMDTAGHGEDGRPTA